MSTPTRPKDPVNIRSANIAFPSARVIENPPVSTTAIPGTRRISADITSRLVARSHQLVPCSSGCNFGKPARVSSLNLSPAKTHHATPDQSPVLLSPSEKSRRGSAAPEKAFANFLSARRSSPEQGGTQAERSRRAESAAPQRPGTIGVPMGETAEPYLVRMSDPVGLEREKLIQHNRMCIAIDGTADRLRDAQRGAGDQF